jgi:ATP-dependent DNA helicase RecG
MKSIEKKNMLNKFERNEISILVSTTVIEVGIDIPNATVMLIEHAERFGLSQLHQLRGRVGRGSKRSYCILVRRKTTETSRDRLAIMEKTSDGFKIADEDLNLRGPGEFIGERQSGFLSYKIANMITDGPIISDARAAAFSIIEKDPSLENSVNKPMKRWFMSHYSNYLEKINLS